MKGGFQPNSRLETTRDEILMEVVEAVRGPEEMRAKAFEEIARLGRRYLELLTHLNGRAPLGAAS